MNTEQTSTVASFLTTASNDTSPGQRCPQRCREDSTHVEHFDVAGGDHWGVHRHGHDHDGLLLRHDRIEGPAEGLSSNAAAAEP